MKEINDPRLLNFLEYVEETQPVDVFEEFKKKLNECADPVNVNLTMLLEAAKKDAPKASERAKFERSMFSGALYHCNT